MTKHINPLEFKDDEIDPAELVTKSISDLTATVETRFKEIETKTSDRLDKLEAKANRPVGGVANVDEAKALETKALNAFFRGGVAALDDIERKTIMIGGSPATGANIVAPEYSSEIISKLVQFSPMRAVASAMGIGTGEVYLPVDNDEIAGGWVTEVGTRPSSDTSFDQVNIKAFEQAVIVPVSQQLL
jgi:HK97 family phage major capsid protein